MKEAPQQFFDAAGAKLGERDIQWAAPLEHRVGRRQNSRASSPEFQTQAAVAKMRARRSARSDSSAERVYRRRL